MKISETVVSDTIDDKFKSYFKYAISSFVSIMYSYFNDGDTYPKYSIGALLRHTPYDILMVLCNNNSEDVKRMQEILNTSICDAVKLLEGFNMSMIEDIKASVDAYVYDTINNGRSNFYSSAFYDITNGIVIEDRMCRRNEELLKRAVVIVERSRKSSSSNARTRSSSNARRHSSPNARRRSSSNARRHSSPNARRHSSPNARRHS